jgi:hypothetical protein
MTLPGTSIPPSFRANAWGPHADLMADRLNSCADYLSRCRRSLNGEIANDRVYFTDKAHELLAAAERLVDGCTSAEHWLVACGAEFEADDGTGCIVDCALAAGHDGEHEEYRGTTMAEQGYRDALRLPGSGQRLSDLLANLSWQEGLAIASPADTADTLSGISGEIRATQVLIRWLEHVVAELRSGGRR